MVKKWAYRIMALFLVAFIVVETREYFCGEVQDYITARDEQRAIWDKKAEWNKQVQQDIIENEENTPKDEEIDEASSFVFEPSEAIGDDFFLDLSTYDMWESGEYSADTGEKVEQRRRLRYPELIAIDCPQYKVSLTEGYSLNICEYDSEQNIIRSIAVKGGDAYVASKNGAFFSISLRKTDQEKSMSPGQWKGEFTDNFEVIVCTEKWLE